MCSIIPDCKSEELDDWRIRPEIYNPHSTLFQSCCTGIAGCPYIKIYSTVRLTTQKGELTVN